MEIEQAAWELVHGLVAREVGDLKLDRLPRERLAAKGNLLAIQNQSTASLRIRGIQGRYHSAHARAVRVGRVDHGTAGKVRPRELVAYQTAPLEVVKRVHKLAKDLVQNCHQKLEVL